MTFIARGSGSVGGEREERQVARPLDRGGHHALVAGTVAGDPARQDLGALQDVLLEQLDVLVVDVLDVLGREAADLAPLEEGLLLAGRLLAAGLSGEGTGRHAYSSSAASTAAGGAATGTSGSEWMVFT